jgi:hypothetical protein
MRPYPRARAFGGKAPQRPSEAIVRGQFTQVRCPIPRRQVPDEDRRRRCRRASRPAHRRERAQVGEESLITEAGTLRTINGTLQGFLETQKVAW